MNSKSNFVAHAADQQPRLLLVEDNELNRELALDMFDYLGYRADVAVNGLQALERVKNARYDAILMDFRMPEMGGIETTERIRALEAQGCVIANSGTARVPIIAVTAQIENDDREQCSQIGMDDVLAKPFDLEQLSEMLKRWLPPQAAASPAQNAPNGDDLPPSPDHPGPQAAPEVERALAAIAALDPSGEKELVKRIIGLYLQGTPELLSVMRQASVDQDSKRLSQAAHTLKSTSANLGLVAMARVSKALEDTPTAASAQDWDTVTTQLNEAENSYPNIESILHGYVDT